MIGDDGKEYPDKYVLYCLGCNKPASYNVKIEEIGPQKIPTVVLIIECAGCKKPKNKVTIELIRETHYMGRYYEIKKGS